MMRIGIDLGGGKIEIIAMGGDSAELLRRHMSATRGDSSGVRGAAWLWEMPA